MYMSNFVLRFKLFFAAENINLSKACYDIVKIENHMNFKTVTNKFRKWQKVPLTKYERGQRSGIDTIKYHT